MRGIGKFFSSIIPLNYREDPYIKRELWKWFLIGLLIKFAFMPFTVFFQDILAVNWRASLIVYHGIYWMGGIQIFVHYIHAFFLWIFKPLMPYFHSILNDPNMGTHCTWEMFETFVGNPYAFRTLFLFKVPYMLFDFGCMLFLLNIFRDPKKGLRAFKFWAINPIVIFATYVAPRYECIVCFFILVSLYYAKKNSPSKSLFFLGVSIITRFYPLVLLPFFVIILGKNLREYIKLTFWGILPWVIIIILSKLFSTTIGPAELMGMYHTNYLLSMRFLLGYAYDKIFVFVAIYTFFLLYVFFNTDHSFIDLCKNGLVVMLTLFATCFFHAQYFMWLIPFLTLQVAKDKRFTWLFVIQVLCYFVYISQQENRFAGLLFTPIDPKYFMSLPSPIEIINRYYPAGKFIGIFRSILTGVSFWMVYLIFKESSLKKRRKAA